MKWDKKRIEAGDIRVIKKFLLFPFTIKLKNRVNQTRWLETIYLLQERIDGYDPYWKDLEYFALPKGINFKRIEETIQSKSKDEIVKAILEEYKIK